MVALFARQLLFSWRPSCSHNAAYAVTSTCVEFLWQWFRIHDVLLNFFLCPVIVGKLAAFQLCFVFSVLYLVADHRYWTRSWAKWKVNEVDDLEFDSREGQEIFLFLKTSRLALGLTRPYVRWVPVSFCPTWSCRAWGWPIAYVSCIKNEWNYNFLTL